MPEREFEIYLSVLGRLLRLSSKQKDAIADELRDHLDERLADLMQSGMSREDAIQQALKEFGDVSGLALDFTNASRIPLRRLAMRTGLAGSVVAGIAMLGLFMFAPEPERGRPLVSVAHAEQDKPANAETPKPVENKKAENPSEFLKDPELFPKFMTEKSGCNFADTPLTDVVEYLATRHKITIKLDVKRLAESGVETDSPITLSLSDVTLEETLHLLLQPLSLGWRVDGDIVIVSTIEALLETYSARHYDLTRALHVGHSLESIKRALIETGPLGWEQDGSGRGTITTFNDTLIIRQSYAAHREISRILAALEYPQRVTPLVQRSNEDKIRAALRRSAECNFADTPSADVVNYLATQAEIPILLDNSALTSAGVAVDVPVTLSLTQKPLSQILRLILSELELTTILQDGVLLVTTKDEVPNRMEVVVYDVASLVVDFQSLCAVGHDLCIRQRADDEKLETLVSMIHSATSGYWEDSGSGSIVPMETGLLVIRSSQAVHEEIADLLNRLHEKTAKSKKPVEPKPVEPKLILRNYLMPKETAIDLYDSLKDLVVAPSWKLPVGGELPVIHVVTAEPILMPVEGYIVGGPVEIRVPDPKTPAKADPNKPAPQGQAGSVKSTLVKPQSNLVIRQTPENHREIERFIRNLTGDVSLRGYDPTKSGPPNGGGFGGGGY